MENTTTPENAPVCRVWIDADEHPKEVVLISRDDIRTPLYAAAPELAAALEEIDALNYAAQKVAGDAGDNDFYRGVAQGHENCAIKARDTLKKAGGLGNPSPWRDDTIIDLLLQIEDDKEPAVRATEILRRLRGQA